MAKIDPKKFIPQNKQENKGLSSQRVSVSSGVSSGSTPNINPSSINPEGNENRSPKTLLSEVIEIRKNLLSILKLIRKDSSLLKKSEERKRKEREQQKFQEKELKSEERKNKLIPDFKPTEFPKMGFLDRIKQFLFYTVLGAAFTKFGKHIPKVLGLLKNLAPAFKFFETLTGNILNGLVDFVGFGYKAYDKVKEIIVGISGDSTEKRLQEFDKQFNTFANLAIIAGMTAAGSVDFDGGGKRERLGIDKQTGQKVSKRAQARYLNQYGQDAYIKKFGKRSFQGLTGKAPSRFTGRLAGKALGKVPIIGGLVDFIISTVIFKEKPGRAAAKAVGATIGSALGTFVPVPFAGTILGGILGDLVGGALYDSLVGGDKLKAKARGGQVTRGGKSVSSPIRRTIKRTRTKPTRIKPQRTMPGKDVGGKEEIKKLFPSPTDPRQKNPLGVLETTSKNYKERVPLIGGIMGAALDSAMGQRPDPNAFKRIGTGFGYLIQNAIDAETNGTIASVQNQIVGLAGGGVVPRTLSSNENIGMKIGERIGKTLETMVNSQVNNTLQSIRQQFTKQDIMGGGGGGFDGGPGGGSVTQDQQEAFEKIRKIAERVGSPNPSVTAAIAMLETGWLSNPNSVYFASGKTNPFGQTGRGPKGSVVGADGQEHAVYNSLEEGVKAHVDRWKSSYIGKTPQEIIESIRTGRGVGAPGMYNTNANWTAKVLSTYQSGTQPRPSKVTSAAFRAILPEGNPVLTSGFGLRNVKWGSKQHKGVDIGVDRGSRVLSAAAGTAYVLDNATWGSFGQAVVVDHGDGTSTLYGHVDPVVKNGQKVKKGDVIAKVKFWPKGAYGAENEDNTHLHFERRLGGVGFSGKAIDPGGYLNSLMPKPTPKPDTRPQSSPPAQVRTNLTRPSWDPKRHSGLKLNPKTGQYETASLGPSTPQRISSGLNQQTSYGDSDRTFIAMQPMEIIKTVPVPIGGGVVNNIASNQSLNQTQVALANA